MEGHPDDTQYQRFDGTTECRHAIADYLASQSSTAVSADEIVVGNGITSVLEALTIALLDEGDSVLIPTPVFPGLVNSMSLRVASNVILMHTDATHDFRLTPTAVEASLSQLQFEGKRVRAILLCSPGNPIGQVFSKDELLEFLEIAETFDCSLIIDEVYAGSVFVEENFVSAVSLQSENVYVLGGLSKDFGLAGHATGWLHTVNSDVAKAVAKQSHFFRLPAPVQRIVATMLQPEWRDAYLQVHKERLHQAYSLARQTLESSGVKVAQAEAGLCLWLDLRQFLPTLSSQAEMELYEYLLRLYRVHISPGAAFKTPTAGFFRLCFSQPTQVLREGLRRLLIGLAEAEGREFSDRHCLVNVSLTH